MQGHATFRAVTLSFKKSVKEIRWECKLETKKLTELTLIF